jgi:hypothetical protein
MNIRLNPQLCRLRWALETRFGVAQSCMNYLLYVTLQFLVVPCAGPADSPELQAGGHALHPAQGSRGSGGAVASGGCAHAGEIMRLWQAGILHHPF